MSENASPTPRLQSRLGFRGDLFLALILAVAFFVTPLFMLPRADPDANTLALYVLSTAALALAVLLRHAVMTFFNSSALFFLVFPFHLQDLLNFSYLRPYSPGMSIWTLCLFTLFLCIVNLIALSRPAPLPPVPRPARDRARRPRAPGVLKCVAIIGVVLALFVLAFGIEEILLSRMRYFLGEVERPSSYEAFIINIFRVVPYWIAYIYVVRRAEGPPMRWLPGLVVIFALALFISNPTNSQRFLSLFGLFIIFFALVRKGHLRSVWLHSYVLLPVALVALPITSELRWGELRPEEVSFFNAVFSLEFSALAILNEMFLAEYDPDGPPLRILSAVLILVPRALWTSKNEGTGIAVAESLGFGFTNIGIPPLADGYLDLGIAGVVLVAIAVGLAFRAARDVVSPADGRHLGFGAAAKVTLVGMTLILLRGDLSTFFVGFYSSLFAFAFARFATRFTLVLR